MSNPTLEQDVTAWEAITKAENAVQKLFHEPNAVDPSMKDLLTEALRKLGAAKVSIKIRRAQRINETGT